MTAMEEEPVSQEGSAEMEATPYSQTTACDHHLVRESPGMAVCSNGCGHGRSFDPETEEIFGGKVVDKA